jgi:hypothetical protein
MNRTDFHANTEFKAAAQLGALPHEASADAAVAAVADGGSDCGSLLSAGAAGGAERLGAEAKEQRAKELVTRRNAPSSAHLFTIFTGTKVQAKEPVTPRNAGSVSKVSPVSESPIHAEDKQIKTPPGQGPFKTPRSPPLTNYRPHPSALFKGKLLLHEALSY